MDSCLSQGHVQIMQRNLYWSTTGISDPSRFNVGLLCIFLRWQKCMHWVFVLEILKPFIIAHLFILLMPYCSWCSAVHIYLDVEVMQKSSTNKYLSTPGFRQLMMLLIFMLKRITDSILPRGIPSSWFWMFDRVEPTRTRNFLFERIAFIKFESLPFNLMFCRSFMIPYLQVASYAFSRSKNITTRCFFLFVCLVLRHINLISHLMPNQVKVNKSEKKFKGEVLGINGKL